MNKEVAGGVNIPAQFCRNEGDRFLRVKDGWLMNVGKKVSNTITARYNGTNSNCNLIIVRRKGSRDETDKIN